MKYALALEGGGSKGSYHAGAIKALGEMNIEIEAVAGTSIGSINGAYYIQEGGEALYRYWENVTPQDLIPDKYKSLTKILENNRPNSYKEFFKEIKNIAGNGGLDLSAFKKTLYGLIDEEKIRKSNINFGLVTFSLTEMKPVEVMINEIPQNRLVEYIIASSYLPGFKREKLDGKSFIDGGFYDNLPRNLLIKNGYKNIIAVELLSISIRKRVKEKNVNIIYLSPSDDLGKIINFDKNICNNNLKMGYYDTRRHFENLYGHWYYIKSMWHPDKAYAFINDLSKNQIEGLAEIMNIKLIPHKRCLFEKIIPGLMEMVSIPDEADYNMILLYILEYVAKMFDINRFQILTTDELIELIRSEFLKRSNEELIDWNESIVKLLKTTRLYTYTFKDKLILGCAQLIMTGKK